MKLPERIEHGMDNLLELEEPNLYSCRVLQMYTNDVFRALSIGIGKKSLFIFDGFLDFNDILYFDGPLIWQGANVSIASIEERNEFIKHVNLKVSSSLNYFLFKFKTSDSYLNIIALHAFFEANASNYRQNKDEELLSRVSIREQDNLPIILKYREYNNRLVPDASSSVEKVLTMFQQGRRFEEILHMMPWLEPEDIQACLAYARHKLK